jgi:hypothetical protein
MSTGQETCAVLGCPMIGSFGVSGSWYCVCHFRADASAWNAITAVLMQHRNIVDQAVHARRTLAGYHAIKAPEDMLIDLTHEVGKQYGLEAAQ